MAPLAHVLCSLLIAGELGLALAATPRGGATDSARQAQGQPVEAVLLRTREVDDTALLDQLQLRSPQRTLSLPPWPSDAKERFALFAVATVEFDGAALTITVVLSDGRAYYRTLRSEGMTEDGVPREAASTVANLLAAIEEDELPPDEEDVPLPPEEEPEPEEDPEPKEEPKPKEELKPKDDPKPKEPEVTPSELEVVLAGTAGGAVGPPDPMGFAGGGGSLGLEFRLPAAAVLSLAVRSHWHRADALTVGRTRISLGGGYAWRRGRFELRSVVGLDVEPWGVRQGGARQPVAYPDGQQEQIGVQLGGHLRVVPSIRIPVGSSSSLRIGARVELAGSALAQDAGVARLLVAAPDGTTSVVARVGGLELMGGLELGLAWSLPTRPAR